MKKEIKTEIIMVRLTPADKAAIKKAADAEAMSISEYTRSAALVYMSLRLDRHALAMLAQGAVAAIREAKEKLFQAEPSRRVKA